MQKLYFLLKTLVVVFTLTAISIGAWLLYANRPIPAKYDSANQTVQESMGISSNYEKGERAAIQHIAAQIRCYPNANTYNVHYHYYFLDGGDSIALAYDRKEAQIFNIDGGSGCGNGYSRVTEEMIQTIAAENGSLNDFAKIRPVSQVSD